METHGRWPKVGAAALGPVAALAVRDSRARPLAALLLHQTEEWVWPGGFLPWINRTVLGSDDDEFPIDRRLGLIINVGVGWSTAAAAFAGPRGALPAAVLYTSNLGNAGLHVAWAVRHRRYDPGVVSAVVGLVPTGVAGLRGLWRDPEVDRRQLGAGIALGAAFGAGLMPLLKRRRRRR
jgi:hypothetical protein